MLSSRKKGKVGEQVETGSDEQIVELFVNRDEAAIEETRAKYGGRLYRTAINILGNHEDSEECVFDTLLKAWDSVADVKPEFLGAYLAKTARNLALNKYKARTAARRGGGEITAILGELEDSLAGSAGPEELYEASLVTKAINDCVNSMPVDMRAVFVLRYFHGESIKEISERFKASENKIKSMLFRARKKLGAFLEKQGISV